MRSFSLFFPFLLGVLIVAVADSEAQTLPTVADPDTRSRFGLVPLGEQFTLAMLHTSLRPREAKVLKERPFRLRSSFVWSNTANRKRGHYLVDAETRTLEFELDARVSERFEIGIRVPLVYRGGGVLDSPIYRWHEVFGLPQETRDDDDIKHDEHRVGGRNDDGSRFDLRRQGTYFGDITLAGQYQFLEEDDSLPALSLRTEVQLPSSAEEFGQDKADVQVAMLIAKGRSNWRMFGGLAYMHALDTVESGLRFMRHRGAAFLGARYIFAEKNALSCALLASTQILAGVSQFPKYAVYTDFAYQRILSERHTLELVLRENPAPDEGTADVSFLIGLQSVFP